MDVGWSSLRICFDIVSPLIESSKQADIFVTCNSLWFSSPASVMNSCASLKIFYAKQQDFAWKPVYSNRFQELPVLPTWWSHFSLQSCSPFVCLTVLLIPRCFVFCSAGVTFWVVVACSTMFQAVTRPLNHDYFRFLVNLSIRCRNSRIKIVYCWLSQSFLPRR